MNFMQLRFFAAVAIDPIPHVTHSGETLVVEAGQYVGLECQVENGGKSKVRIFSSSFEFLPKESWIDS